MFESVTFTWLALEGICWVFACTRWLRTCHSSWWWFWWDKSLSWKKYIDQYKCTVQWYDDECLPKTIKNNKCLPNVGYYVWQCWHVLSTPWKKTVKKAKKAKDKKIFFLLHVDCSRPVHQDQTFDQTCPQPKVKLSSKWNFLAECRLSCTSPLAQQKKWGKKQKRQKSGWHRVHSLTAALDISSNLKNFPNFFASLAKACFPAPVD